MTTLSETIAECGADHSTLDALERADQSSELADWLQQRNFPEDLAGDLVDAGIRSKDLERLTQLLTHENSQHGMRILVYDHQILCLTREIENLPPHSDLIQAVKAYSYMDKVPISDVDVEYGIDVTLRMFQHQLKHGFTVRPPIRRQSALRFPPMAVN